MTIMPSTGLTRNGLANVKLKEKEIFLSPLEIKKEIGEVNLQ